MMNRRAVLRIAAGMPLALGLRPARVGAADAALHLVDEPLAPGLYGVPPLKEDHPEVAPLIRW